MAETISEDVPLRRLLSAEGSSNEAACAWARAMVVKQQLLREQGQKELRAAAVEAPPVVAPAVRPEVHSVEGLVAGVRELFAEEKARAQAQGYTIGKDQPPETSSRLDEAVRSLMTSYCDSGAQDWRRYAYFCDHHYVRNLVDANDEFELIVICWKNGQGSRVHDHAKSHCWLTCLQGPMEELQYITHDLESWNRRKSFMAAMPQLPGVVSCESPCPTLQHIATHTVDAGQTAYINDNMCLHAVRCPAGDFGHEGGVSLHLYSPPIRRVRLFEPDADKGVGRVVERTPGFFTVGGVKPQRTV